MRKFIVVALSLLSSVFVYATDITYTGQLVNETGLGYSKSYSLDVNDSNYISFQAVWSSAPIPSASTIYDGKKSTGTITISSSTALTNQTLYINGELFLGGRDFVVDKTSSCALSLKNAINSRSILGLTCSVINGDSVIYCTSTVTGYQYNYTLVSSSPTAMTAQNLTGGTNSSINYWNSLITKASHGYTTGVGLCYQVTAGTTFGGLTDGTTYYAIVNDANSFRLATSKANAGLGTYVVITGTTAANQGNGSYTLTPSPWSGTCGMYWQCSNDNSNWYTLNITSVSYTGGAGSNQMWYGSATYRFMRFVVDMATQGALNLTVTGNGKR